MEAIITPFAPNVMNVLKFTFYTLLLIPAVEFMLGKALKSHHWRQIKSGTPIKLRSSPLGLWALHTTVDQNSIFERILLRILALCFLASMLALEFGFDTISIPKTRLAKVPSRFSLDDVKNCGRCDFVFKLDMNAREKFTCGGRSLTSDGYCSTKEDFRAIDVKEAVEKLAPPSEWAAGFESDANRTYINHIEYGGLTPAGLYSSKNVVFVKIMDNDTAVFYHDKYVWLSGNAGVFRDEENKKTTIQNAHRLFQTDENGTELLALTAISVLATWRGESRQYVEEFSESQLVRVTDLIELTAIDKPFRLAKGGEIMYNDELVEADTELRATIAPYALILTGVYFAALLALLLSTNCRAANVSIEGLFHRAVASNDGDEYYVHDSKKQIPITGYVDTEQGKQTLLSTYEEDMGFSKYT